MMMMIPGFGDKNRLLHQQSVASVVFVPTMLSHDPSPSPWANRPAEAHGRQAISLCMPLKPESLHVDLHEHHEEAYHSPVPWRRKKI